MVNSSLRALPIVWSVPLGSWESCFDDGEGEGWAGMGVGRGDDAHFCSLGSALCSWWVSKWCIGLWSTPYLLCICVFQYFSSNIFLRISTLSCLLISKSSLCPLLNDFCLLSFSSEFESNCSELQILSFFSWDFLSIFFSKECCLTDFNLSVGCGCVWFLGLFHSSFSRRFSRMFARLSGSILC